MNRYYSEGENFQNNEALDPSRNKEFERKSPDIIQNYFVESIIHTQAEISVFVAAIETFAAAQCRARGANRPQSPLIREPDQEFVSIDGDCNESQPCCGDEFVDNSDEEQLTQQLRASFG